VLFGSEIKAFLPALREGGAAPQVDLEAIHHYLTFNYIPAPWTIWQGIRHVMPGTWMRFTRTRRARRSAGGTWRCSASRTTPSTPGREEFLAILDDATRIRLRADVPWGAFLSGGVDSSSIVGLMARHVDQPVKTFCIGFADPRFDESGYAAEAARRFGCEHTARSPN
jgi:asparagine synthase (glutamine-hydrolysing)